MRTVQLEKNKDYLIYIISHSLFFTVCCKRILTVGIWHMYQYIVHVFDLFSVLFIAGCLVAARLSYVELCNLTKKHGRERCI